jgi:hypothetical protein
MEKRGAESSTRARVMTNDSLIVECVIKDVVDSRIWSKISKPLGLDCKTGVFTGGY